MTTIDRETLHAVTGGADTDKTATADTTTRDEDDKSWIRDAALPDWAQCTGGFWHGCGPNDRRNRR